MKNWIKLLIFSVAVMFGNNAFAQCSARCQAAFRFVISHEDRNLSGVVTAEPLGGFARYGINSRANHAAVRDGFYQMNKKHALVYAQNLFYTNYWSPIRGDDISDRKLALRMADLSFNLGTVRATKLLQRAMAQQGAYLPIGRGYFGESTLFYANSLPSERTIKQLKRQAHTFYVGLAEKYPAMRKWQGVWLDRLAEVEDGGVPMPEWLADIASATHPDPVLAVDIIQWRIQFEYNIYTANGITVRCGRHRKCYFGEHAVYRPQKFQRYEGVVEVIQQEGEVDNK